MSDSVVLETVGDEEEGTREVFTRAEVENEMKLKEQEFNQYATSKSVSQTLLDTSSIQAQIVILVSTLSSGPSPLSTSQIGLVTLISISLALQFVIFLLLAILATSRLGKVGKCCTTPSINSLVTTLTGFLMIITSGISVLAINSSNTTTTP